jgi:hypothetical protein
LKGRAFSRTGLAITQKRTLSAAPVRGQNLGAGRFAC